METLAAVLRDVNKPLKIEKLAIPQLKAGQVLVRLAYSGLCHSQLNEIRGLRGPDKFLPHTLGHEGSGIVEEVGPDVKKVKRGDWVVLTWIKSEGIDVPSTTYKTKDGSAVNSGAISTFLNKAIISENRLVKIPEKMPLLEAALLGCAIPTGAGMVMNTLRPSADNSLAIFGIGGIGISALLAAKITGVSTIIAVDILDSKLEQAKQFGATHLINARKQDVLRELMDITDKRGVDYAIESAGKKESMELAFSSVRDKGGLCVLAGNLAEGESISINPFDLIKGKGIVGSWGGQTNPDIDIPKYVDLYLNGKLNLTKLITDQINFENINKGFSLLESASALRIMLKF